MLNGQDDKDRVVKYEYTLVYGLDGRVDETQPVRVRLDLGRRRGDVRPAEHPGGGRVAMGRPQPHVTEANVRSLDLANGGGSAGRLARGPRPSARSPSTRRAVHP